MANSSSGAKAHRGLATQMQPSTPATRVLTHHGTALYVDSTSGQMRHGDPAATPANAFFAARGASGRFVHLDGARLSPIACDAMGSRPAAPGAGTIFDILPAGRDLASFKADGLFLCAEAGGAVTLSKPARQAWEIFSPAAGDSPELAYLRDFEAVEGWANRTAATVIHRLLRWQAQSGVGGDVLEIGVHHGRLFLLLALCAAPGERAVAIDIFDDQHLNDSLSGQGDRQALEANILRHAPGAAIEIVKANSMSLGGDFVAAYGGQRFVSVDGGHSREVACNDMHLAERLLAPGGIAALDDIYRPDWSGVTAGLHAY